MCFFAQELNSLIVPFNKPLLVWTKLEDPTWILYFISPGWYSGHAHRASVCEGPWRLGHCWQDVPLGLRPPGSLPPGPADRVPERLLGHPRGRVPAAVPGPRLEVRASFCGRNCVSTPLPELGCKQSVSSKHEAQSKRYKKQVECKIPKNIRKSKQACKAPKESDLIS